MSYITNRHEARSWQKKYNIHAPRVDELAPDFELMDTNGENPIRLSELIGKQPVALVFGSFT
ncbi:MAG: hypothetical protein IMY76_02900 [Chloroflexi bacterium]|nr:hypothetical protein [Chloroflexota bacterium]